MKLSDLLKETYIALTANKGRSILTMLGIVIGIASVVGLMSVGTGASKSITQNIEAGGANLLTISPGAQQSTGSMVRSSRGSAKTLTMDDVAAIKKQVANIDAVAPMVSGNYQIVAKGSNTNSSVTGVNADYAPARDLVATQGKFISDAQVNSNAKVAVLGATVASDIFGSDSAAVGQSIRIKNMNFKVIGVLKATGGLMNSSDDSVFIPITTDQRYFSGDAYVNTIIVKAVDQKSMTAVQSDITALLLKRHKIADSANADFSVRNMADMVAMASSITGTLTALLGAIGGISLLVGGIGIMNMMLTSVTERTKEIGLRKAIGATRRDITSQFLMEAIMLTFFGGIFGIIFGYLAAVLIAQFSTINASITVTSVLLAFGVSALVGLAFGYYPARRAAKLNPIEALRYE